MYSVSRSEEVGHDELTLEKELTRHERIYPERPQQEGCCRSSRTWDLPRQAPVPALPQQWRAHHDHRPRQLEVPASALEVTYSGRMPTPDEAIAHADALHLEARTALMEHHTRTGKIDTQLQRQATDAAHAAGLVRAAAAAANDTPEQKARTKEMVDSFPHRLAHTLIGPGNSKGRVDAFMLSDDQFTQWQSTGTWNE